MHDLIFISGRFLFYIVSFCLITSLLQLSQLFGQENFPPNGRLFADSSLPCIDILINQDSLDKIQKYENRWSDHEFKADFVFSDDIGKDTIKNIGFRLRGYTSRSSQKKSFKVSFNTFAKGRKFYGVEKLNLNGEHNDPSLVRSKFCFDLAKQIGVISSRANHVLLYINKKYFGVYINVEHIDEEFVKSRFENNNGNLYKCLYPADLRYVGNNQEYYKKVENGRRIYDLKTNKDSDDYTDLVNFIKILHITSDNDFRCEIEKIFDVDSYLKVMVFDILTANWDDYIFNKNNFYLYHDPESDKFIYIPYDLDNTWGIDWFQKDWAKRNIYQWSNESENRVLYKRILQEPVYRSRFTSIMKNVLDSVYKPLVLKSYLYDKRKLISKAVQADTFYSLDYGFTFDDFYESYDIAPGFDHVPVGIMEFIDSRRFWAINQLELDDLLALDSEKYTILSDDKDSVRISLSLINSEFVNEVKLSYSFDDAYIFFDAILHDDATNGDLFAGDNIFSSAFIPIGNAKSLKYYFNIKNTNGYNYKVPACGLSETVFPDEGVTVAINEFMASNNYTIQDNAGEFDDWIELYNYGEHKIYLGDKFLTDKKDNKTKWKMPDEWLLPNEFIIFWADKDEEQGENHCNFKLSASGEYIGIYNSELSGTKLIDEYKFDVQQSDVSTGRIPDGTGSFQLVSPTPGYENMVNDINKIVDSDIRVFPNPFNAEINVSHVTGGIDIKSIEIIEVKGEPVKILKNFKSKNHKLDLQQLDSGVYLIIIVTEKKRFVFKMIKL